jgi:RNA polymerase sigma factor (sigma-70 family)
MYEELEDLDLIKIVRQGAEHSSEAMTEIINRHSGIFIEIINHYVPPNSPYCNKEDMIKEKSFYMYKALIKYDETKGTKFSTHLGNEAKWLCLNSYNKAKSRSMFSSSDYEFDKPTEENPHISLINEESLNKVMKIINDFPDERVEKIFKMRYIDGDKNKVMPWKKISKDLDMSIQGCINIHNKIIKKIQTKIKKEC